jgi:hypothetical protein
MRKGQTEVLGFAMVMLLVSVGMLFIVGFIILREPSDIKRVFTDKQLAVNMNDALLSSTSGCKGIEFERLIIDCAQYQEILCDTSNTISSCSHIETAMRDIFTNTLEKWGKGYKYQIYFEGMDPMIHLNSGDGACNGDLEPGIFYLPTTKGTVFVRLDICE